MKDIIQEIWEIRGMLDEAVATNNQRMYEQVKDRFLNLIDTEEYKYSLAADTIEVTYRSSEEMEQSREYNFNKIVLDWKNAVNQLRDEKRGVEHFEPASVLEHVWNIRGELDKTMRIPSDGFESTMNKITKLEKMEHAMITLAHKYYPYINDIKTCQERSTLNKLAAEFCEERDVLWHIGIDKEHIEQMMLNDM